MIRAPLRRLLRSQTQPLPLRVERDEDVFLKVSLLFVIVSFGEAVLVAEGEDVADLFFIWALFDLNLQIINILAAPAIARVGAFSDCLGALGA